MINEPSNDIRLGRRALESIKEYTLLNDLVYDRDLSRWVLHFSIRGYYQPTDEVPVMTNWYCLLSNEYPFGSIEIYPDSLNGIETTFQHMSYNATSDRAWRTGNICIKTNLGGWGRNLFNSEPFTASDRLHWNVTRALAWVTAAAEGHLAQDGDPYEFPDIPKSKTSTFVFNETSEGFEAWSEIPDEHGVFEYFVPTLNSNIRVIERVVGKKVGLQYEWGSAIKKSTRLSEGRGYWLRLKSTPVLSPWQIPMNFSELATACQVQGINFFQILRENLGKNSLTDEVSHIALGFPVGQYINSSDQRMHWFHFEWPKLKDDIKGYKKGTSSYYREKVDRILSMQVSLRWTISENWAKDQLTARGRLSNGFDLLRFCIIGAGAIGSSFAELLARLGCHSITVVDHDIVATGNFSRHTLDMRSCTKFKAAELANRLNLIFPFMETLGKTNRLNWVAKSNSDFYRDYDIFVDATGDDGVLAALCSNVTEDNQLLVSLSINVNASELYCFLGVTGGDDLFVRFNELMKPWSAKQQREEHSPVFVLENVGCWHPVFPARIDDIFGLLAPTIRQLEQHFIDGGNTRLVVIKREETGNINIIS